MRVAVISDVHANWQALNTALADARRQGAKAIWCLGDVVGYGPNPYRCWRELVEFCQVPMSAWVSGNHDWGLIGRLESRWFLDSIVGLNSNHELVGDFGEHAWDVIRQHRTVLQTKTALWRWFDELPLLASPVAGVYLAHGIMDPDPLKTIGTYARVPELAEHSLSCLRTSLNDMGHALSNLPQVQENGWAAPRLMLVGHTHEACAWQRRSGDHDSSRWDDSTKQLAQGARWFDDLERRPVFANPGSVGFPRDDRANLATYLLVDWDEQRLGLWLRRVAYDPTNTVRDMRDAGTNEEIYRRLAACIPAAI